MSPDPMLGRKRLRAEGYDYTQPGWYFITICTQGRSCLLGSITNGVVDLSPAGQMVEGCLRQMPDHFTNVELDAIVIMPNHIHGIVILNPVDDGPLPVTLSGVVQAYKRLTTHSYIRNVHELGWARFAGHLWQRSFHDVIIRNDRHLDRLRTYIEANPFLWPKDTYYTTDDTTL